MKVGWPECIVFYLDLEAATEYSLEIRARNVMEWSDPNDEFKFVTAAAPVEGAMFCTLIMALRVRFLTKRAMSHMLQMVRLGWIARRVGASGHPVHDRAASDCSVDAGLCHEWRVRGGCRVATEWHSAMKCECAARGRSVIGITSASITGAEVSKEVMPSQPKTLNH